MLDLIRHMLLPALLPMEELIDSDELYGLALIILIVLAVLLPIGLAVVSAVFIKVGIHLLNRAMTNRSVPTESARVRHRPWPARLAVGIVGLVFIGLGAAIGALLLSWLILAATSGK